MSFLGDSLGLVALMLHVADTTGQALAVALVLLAGDFAPALLGPLAGTAADRLDRRRVMIGGELLQGALVAVTALWLPSLPALLALVGLRAVAGQVFQPASRAAVPALVPERDLERANAAVGVATNGGETLGPLVAAVALPILEVRGVLLVDAATFGVSAVLLGFLPAMPRTVPGLGRQASFLADAGGGLRYVWAEPTVQAVALGYFAVVACNGIDDVALVFLATDTLGGGQSAVGLLLAAVGIGLLAGYALLARARGRLPMTALLLGGFAVSSAGNLLTGLAWAVAAAFCVQAVRGLGIAALDVAATTLVQRIVPSELLGRVFGSLYGGIGVAAALAYLLGGLLLDRTSPPGRLRGRRRRRPAGHRRHRPGPAPGRELTICGGFPETGQSVHSRLSVHRQWRWGMGSRRVRMAVVGTLLVAMTLLGTALAPAGASTGPSGAVVAATGRAPPASATTTSRSTATAATTSATTC